MLHEIPGPSGRLEAVLDEPVVIDVPTTCFTRA
jgi:hypothetical protein